MAQSYSANAPGTTLAGGITNSATSMTLTDASGWPTSNFVATLERDTAKEEQVYVGTRSGNNFTGVTRGYNSTSAVDHDGGAVIEHTFDAASAQRWEDHLFDAAGAHEASAISFTPSGSISATTVQAAVGELDSEKAPIAEPIAAAHITDPTAAHAASAVSFTPAGTIASSTVQAAVAEVATDAAASLSTHELDTTLVHGITDTSALVTSARQIISGAALTGGGPLTSDLTLNVGVDGSSIEVSSDAVRVKASGITSAHLLDGTVAIGDLNAGLLDTIVPVAIPSDAVVASGDIIGSTTITDPGYNIEVRGWATVHAAASVDSIWELAISVDAVYISRLVVPFIDVIFPGFGTSIGVPLKTTAHTTGSNCPITIQVRNVTGGGTLAIDSPGANDAEYNQAEFSWRRDT